MGYSNDRDTPGPDYLCIPYNLRESNRTYVICSLLWEHDDSSKVEGHVRYCAFDSVVPAFIVWIDNAYAEPLADAGDTLIGDWRRHWHRKQSGL